MPLWHASIPSGSALDYATFLGGNDTEGGGSILFDGSGRIHVVGSTGSSNFPMTTNGFTSIHSGGNDVFIVRLNAAGNALDYAASWWTWK